MYDVRKMLEQLTLGVSWLPKPTSAYLTNWQGNQGNLNIAWKLAGEPDKVDESLFTSTWYTALKLGNHEISNEPIRSYASRLSAEDFYWQVVNGNEYGVFKDYWRVFNTIILKL